jgi:tRNA(Ile)-lysidine synthase TilS/MesJ
MPVGPSEKLSKPKSWPRLKQVLLAVSGGPDSMALALAAGFELPKIGIKVSAAIVNHNLQLGSGEVAMTTANRLKNSASTARVIDITVPSGSGRPRGTGQRCQV